MNLAQVLAHISNVDTLPSLLDAIDDFECNTFVKIKDGTYISCNDNAAITLGYESGEQIIGRKDIDVLPPRDFILCSTNDNEVMQSGQIKIFMEPFISPRDGQPMIATSIKMPLRTKNKKVIGMTGFSIIQEDPSLDKTRQQFGLTERQLDCLFHLVRGRSMKMIANELKLSPRTVEHYLDAAKLKLDCESKTDLIEKALSIPYIKNRL